MDLIAIAAFFVCAPFIANDRPLIIRFDGRLFFPALVDYPETAFGGDFEMAADYRDPQVRKLITESVRRQSFRDRRHPDLVESLAHAV